MQPNPDDAAAAGGSIRGPAAKRTDRAMLLMVVLVVLLVAPSCGAMVVDGGGGLKAIIGSDGGVNVTLDGEAWLFSDSSAPATFLGGVVHLKNGNSTRPSTAGGIGMQWVNTHGLDLPWITEVVPGPVDGSLVFRQTWPQGYAPPVPAPAPSPAANATCGAVLEHTDQSGGHMCCGTPPGNSSAMAGFRGLSKAECCQICLANKKCNRYVMAEARVPTDPTCWLIAGAKGTYARSSRSMGRITGRPGGGASTPIHDQNAVLAGFPAFANGAAELPLNLLGWGGCQLSPGHGEDDIGTHIARWTGGSPVAGAAGLTPFVLYSKSGRAVVMSPMENFFVGIHSTVDSQATGLLQAGIKATVTSLPVNFSHSTILFAGHGMNDTLIGFGDVLLAKSGKARVDPYEDFILSHLGHWNDAGAYYYHNPSPFNNYQEALLAVKADAEARQIPFRYSQWDDWWAYQHGGDFGNDGGVTDWWPMPHVFPSGLTDWLGLPLSLYSSSYSGDNIYNRTARYNWKIDMQKHALPVGRDFYDDIFANGTKAGMKMFEQDFLCSINLETELTNQDIYTGQAWLDGMNAAAATANISLQMCMMNPVHTLATTLMHKVTNGRATRDNHPGQDRTNAGSGLVLGISGMLHYALGIWPSRDNVWTNRSVSQHGGPEPMVETQTLMAFLAGGPYGPSDCAGCGNRSLIMRSCRKDGVLLRADKPITMLDSAFTAVPFEGAACEGSAWFDLTCEVIHVWATHSDISGEAGLRYGYVLGLDLRSPYNITPGDILPTMGGHQRREYRVWEYWGGLKPGPDTTTTACDEARPFALPAGEICANSAVVVSSYFVMAPVLANGWTYLGEPNKLVTVSRRRVHSIDEDAGGLSVCVAISMGEELTAFARSPDAKIYSAECHSNDVEEGDVALDADVLMLIRCRHGECTCEPGCNK